MGIQDSGMGIFSLLNSAGRVELAPFFKKGAKPKLTPAYNKKVDTQDSGMVICSMLSSAGRVKLLNPLTALNLTAYEKMGTQD